MTEGIITIEHFPRSIFLRILLAPFTSIQHTVSVNGGRGYVYQIMKIVFGNVVVTHTVIATINEDSAEYKKMNKDLTETLVKNIQVVGPEGNS